MKTEMQREYEQLCRIDENPGVQGLAQLGRNAINRVSRLESQLARADARIAELEREIERLDAQWRDELRIYRESEDARIAELEAKVARMRADAERWRYCNANAEWFRNEERTRIAIAVEHGADLSCKALREIAIDAARANGGEW